ncbi:glucose-1-phosphate thymidylyltransferase RfbA [Nocardiopsis ganjiahuensis]|uniref:glucose-1-phosphate thymidylyltransferase RfbA n=1 Tax=Nocardiopsis ganjiahuensis TaxID=239984 RepID=UPI000475DB90|nr:glucose-1-phosphate thymidylyltransferase RfbA [Nocardiopsis ganjiahuensis]
MKGIVLAGGTGSRLYPSTRSISKHLFPVYDKPMFYYPLSVLMTAGIREVLVVSNPDGLPLIQRVLGDGSALGMDIRYAVQTEPRGIAEALVIGRDHISGHRSALVLGDNMFHGEGLDGHLNRAASSTSGCTLFGCKVSDPRSYAVAGFGEGGAFTSLEEKPAAPKSDYAVAGLYFYDQDVVDIAMEVEPSGRGELEITDVNRAYLERGRAEFVTMANEVMWLDLGTEESLLEGGRYVSTMARDSGVRVACLEEIALRMGFIGVEECHRLGAEMANSPYGEYVMEAARRAAGLQQGAGV